jgi:photosystem II stability/assembly factor-like uncharacterized protein
MILNRVCVAFLAVFLLNDAAEAQWVLEESGTKARFRGLSVVGPEFAWASGTGGTFARTFNGGGTWRPGRVPGADALDFRDVQAFDENTAYLLSSGQGELSRLYKTTDGGQTWNLLLTNPDAAGFLDAIAFWDADHGLILGDPVDGRFVILATADGGKTWRRTERSGMPEALSAEGAFAASGTCLTVHGKSHAWFGTGGGKSARVFRTTDGGLNWSAHATPIRAAIPTSGIFSVAFADENHGIAVGGDYKRMEETQGVIALTKDGGVTWSEQTGSGPAGYRSAVAFLSNGGARELVAVGPTGTDLSEDGGVTWRKTSSSGFHAVGFAGKPSVGWAAGDDGTIAKFTRLISR